MRAIPDTRWIWTPDWNENVNGEPVLMRFRRSFDILQRPERKLIKISADTRYKLYVNGQFAEFGPARGDQRVWYVDTVDIAPYLREGRNILAAEVLRYPLAYRGGNFGMARTTTPGLFVEDADGLLSADSRWKCKAVCGFRITRENPGFAPLMFIENDVGDARDAGWKTADYDDSDWSAAGAYSVMEISEAACPGDLSPRPIPYLKREPRRFIGVMPTCQADVARRFEALLRGEGTVRVPAGQTLSVELNAGELTTGYISLRLAGGAGASVKLLTSEGYVQKQFRRPGVPQKGDRCDWKNGVLNGFTDEYRPCGIGTEHSPEVFEPFWFRTFRFIKLTVEAGGEDCVVCGLDYIETGYPLEVKTVCEASDPSFAGIWDISLRTLKRCMHETYEDCPFYEQLQYAMDSRSEILYTYAVSGDDRLAKQCMEAFRLSQRADGLLNACYPHWGPNVIPGFSVYYILMVHDHMMYFGDKMLIKKHLGCIDGILNYFDNHLDPRGIVGKTGGHISERYWSFIDWATPWCETVGTPPSGLNGPITMESLLYAMGLQHAAELCDFVGRGDTAAEYRDRAASLKNAINAYCRDEYGFYLDSPGVKAYSQHCQTFALLTDTVSVDEGRPLLLATLEDRERFAQCTVASMFYVFRALEKAGCYDRTKPLWDLWRAMLKKNLTTCVEDGADERSDCHAWGSVLLYELPAVILGVRPAAPGYEKVTVAPQSGYLNWANGDVTTPWGNVHVEWIKENGALRASVAVPEGTRHRFEIHV